MDLLLSEGFRTALHLAGRVMFSMLFIMMGMMHLMKLNDFAAYAAARGVPAAKPMTVIAGLMILSGGVMLLLGWHRFIGAGLIALFLVPNAFLMHAFWAETEAAAQQNEMAYFAKDLALAGAAVLIAFYAAFSWPVSLGG
jgi:uncharacterized membrane protein YphA (DoxX/SURF4 family)